MSSGGLSQARLDCMHRVLAGYGERGVAILMTQCMGFPSGLYPDFWTLVYQAIDD
jgi:hypothetical protein